MTKIMLTVPEKGNDLSELKRFLEKEKADITIFPEGFLTTEHLEEALELIKRYDRFVISGWKEERSGNVWESALVIDGGRIVGEYQKCILTRDEKQKGKRAGESIHCIETRYGKIGIPICYEIHFPEVARCMALEEPVLLVNLIGTGMYHDLQYAQWTSLARARAIENEVIVAGCSHYKGEIPLAFVYSPKGELLAEKREAYGSLCLEVDLQESKKKAHRYLEDRVPEVFGALSGPKGRAAENRKQLV